MTARGNVMACLRVLLLPMRATRELVCARALGKHLRALGIPHSDFSAWIHLETDEWRETGNASVKLRGVISTVLGVTDPVLGIALARKYFLVHSKLQANHFLSHDEARAFLSNSFLIADLTRLEFLSAAQISRLLTGRGYGIQFSRQSVSEIVSAFGLTCALSIDKVKALYSSDASNELGYFADADASLSASVVEEAAQRLGFATPLKDALIVLAPDKAFARYAPYLQILHYQCSIAEFYDHAVSDMYEFSPRGSAALWLFKQYPKVLLKAGNPFLNNAKSVETLDTAWVRSKKPVGRPGAKALFQVLDGLDQMQFAPRRELAKVLRLWLHRIMRLSMPHTVTVPVSLTPAEVEKLLQGVARANTGTYGVLEQRVVDALSSLQCPIDDGWRSRGLGDSVNTTNVSKRKIGDCDYQHSDGRRIIAYESHGGELTDVYVNEHLRTVAKSLKIRAQELEGIADLDEWKIKVVFVAHRLAVSHFAARCIEGVQVSLEFITFIEFIDSMNPALADWDQHLLIPMREGRTPNEVRSTLRALSGASELV